MTKFSLGRENDSDSYRRPDPKRQRTTSTPSPPLPILLDPIPNRGRLVPCTEQNFDSAEEEEEEEVDEEEDEEEEEEEEDEFVEEEEHDEDETVEISDQVQRGGNGKMVEKNDSSQNARSTGGDGAISVILSDPDVLDCPICLEPLTTPVFQCENGHVACNCCCSKLKNRCPSCCLPIGYNRCRAIEKVIESIKIPCQNMKYGCKITVPYTKKHDHEHECLHAPCSCPLVGCSFVGSSQKLYQHFSSKHIGSARPFYYDEVFSVFVFRGGLRYIILQENSDDIIFILNFSHEDYGTMVNVNCIGPTTNKRGCSYQLTAKNGETSVVLNSVTKNVPNWVEHRTDKAFLVIPQELDITALEVCIRRPS